MKGFIAVHDEAWSNRVTVIRKKAITSVAETLTGKAVIVYGNDIIVETGESFADVLRLMKREEL